MAIYTTFGNAVTLSRYATEDDVRRLDPPLDKEARRYLANRQWVVGVVEGGKEQIIALWNLRADDGLREIAAALPKEGV